MINPNSQIAQAFVDELAKGGVREVCIAPGSRSTPLTLAFTRQPQIRVTMHLDERCAAFFALGLALSSCRSVAIMCTSGSAAANFMPAIVEARMSGVPLLVLTADRPDELRGSGANQTIDQVKLYGEQVLLSVDLPIPEIGQSELVLRHVRTLAARSLAVADGLLKGPVHLNFPFRKPLEPDDEAGFASVVAGTTAPYTRWDRGVLQPTQTQVETLADLINQSERGLIVCGPRCPAGEFPAAVSRLARKARYALLADPLSGLRFGPEVGDWLVGGYDSFAELIHCKALEPAVPHLGVAPESLEDPQVVIRIGGMPISTALAGYLGRIRPERRVQIAVNGVWADEDHCTDWFLQADEVLTCRMAADRVLPRTAIAFSQKWRRLEQLAWERIRLAAEEGDLFDGATVAQVLDWLPDGANLFMGNSLAIRHLDQFGQPRRRQIAVYGNRGASGIDGNVSTALGVAAAQPEQPLVAILGDITFYHDMNGLLAVRRLALENVTFVVINNNGGGIFQQLPVRRFEPPFRQAFLSPHGLEFSAAAKMYGLDYVKVHERDDLAEALAAAFGPGAAHKARLIEVQTDSQVDLERRKTIRARVHAEIRQAAILP
jgi:2-succinyl-5-enolpyruvyl-6-hydroxy-3-cyclohexene-1-carboxylate synthase